MGVMMELPVNIEFDLSEEEMIQAIELWLAEEHGMEVSPTRLLEFKAEDVGGGEIRYKVSYEN
jgi:hypothetical protein